MDEDEPHSSVSGGYIALAIIFFLGISYGMFQMSSIVRHEPIFDFTSGDNYLKCKWTAWTNKDSYCVKDFSQGWNNVSRFTNTYVYSIRYHSVDKINEENALKQAQKQREIADAYTKNYNAGHSVFESYDIISDHNFSCKQIEYINDHFITVSSKEDAGYISGSYSGFLSHGSVTGKMYQWVYSEILATGQLAESVSYYVLGDNTTIDKKIDYYTTSEFVMYFVKHCIEE